MENKTFGDLRGVLMRHIDGQVGTSYIGNFADKNKYKILFRGDPIFIVDIVNNVIKACVVKAASHGCGSKIVTLKCSENTKNRDFKPTVDDLSGRSKGSFDGCITVRVPNDASISVNASTTLKGAIKLLNAYKNKEIFASLEKGDKIYAVNRSTNEIEELVIEKIRETNGNGIFKIDCIDKTRISMGFKYYEDKVSIYNDASFYYHSQGGWYSPSSYFVFVSKEKAQAFLKERLKADKKRNTQPKDGTDTKLKDSGGKPIHIGDTVAYVNGSGSYIKISIAKVINNSEKMVKIFDEDEKKAHIEFCEANNKHRIEMGLKPFKNDYTNSGIKSLTTNKVLVIKK